MRANTISMKEKIRHMKKLKSFVESGKFQNFILIVIVFNAIIMGLQTSDAIIKATGSILAILDNICLGIFVVELLLKFVVYRFRFFLDGWNIFDFIIVVLSFVSGLEFLSSVRVFRVFRVFRSFKALKSLRAFRLISSLSKLRMIITAIGRSIPGIMWSGVLLLLIYYIFAIMGTSLFGADFPDWFGSLGKSMYTLFQVMTLESWSMGISRPVMEVFSWAWIYFVPFVLISAFVVMNVVVGIVVNSISEVTAEDAKEANENNADSAPELEEKAVTTAELKTEISALQAQLTHIEDLLRKQEK